jgi:phage terminase large subunit-like protein
VVVTFNKEAQRVVLVWHRIFQPSAREPLDFEATIERTLREVMRRFAVRGVFYDPYQMASTAQRLQQAGVPMREFPQTSGGLTEIGNNLFELIKGRGLLVYPDAEVRLAVSRAVAVETSRGWRISKEKAAHKIDVVVALAMAAFAAVQRQWDEEVPIAVPFFGSAGPRYYPGSSEFTGAGVPTPSSAPSAYDYSTNDSWKAYVNPDGSIRSKPRGPWDY